MDFDHYQHSRINDDHVLAFISGRRLSRLHWHLQQGWILACDLTDSSPTWRHFSRAERIYDAIAATAYECVFDEPDKWFRAIVSEKERVSSAAFPDGCYEQHLWWSVYDTRHRDESDADRREQFSRENVFPHYQRTRSLVHKMFDKEHRTLLRIGELIEGGLCRPDVVRFSIRSGSWEELAGDSNLMYEEPVAGDQEIPEVTNIGDGPDFLATESLDPGDLAPQREWASHLSAACAAVGVDVDIPALKSLRAATLRQRLNSDRLRSYIREICEHICESIGLAESTIAKSPSIGYLGLRVNRESGRVTRENCSSHAMLSKKEMQVFHLLSRQQGSVVELSGLLSIWGDQVSAKSAMQTTISRLNKKLVALRVWVDNERGIGYCLKGHCPNNDHAARLSLTKV